MYRKIIDKLKGKNIVILGFGKEGKSSYEFIRRHLKEQPLTILDQNEISLEDPYCTLITGEKYLDSLEEYDMIIKSPGISLKDISLENIQEKITSQLELLLEVFRKNVIGITGTKGKSTTTTLTYEVIKDQKDSVYLLGNIGIPIFDQIEEYRDDTILVIEMSSHQLEFLKASPHIACILNLYQDHLDHAGTLEHYHDNKMNIFKYQDSSDYCIYSSDNDYLRERMASDLYQGKRYTVRFDMEEMDENAVRLDDKKVILNGEVLYEDGERKLIGNHNLKNIMFTLTIASILKLDLSRAKNVIRHFNGLKYRMECIGEVHGITYYNDTIATIPWATMNAVEAIGNVDTLIFGGMDRGIDYEEFITFLKSSSISNMICMPTTGNFIGKELENSSKNVFYVPTLEEAYACAKSHTKKGMSCLLSPAAASYEFFKNFEEKGKAFEDIVKRDS